MAESNVLVISVAGTKPITVAADNPTLVGQIVVDYAADNPTNPEFAVDVRPAILRTPDV